MRERTMPFSHVAHARIVRKVVAGGIPVSWVVTMCVLKRIHVLSAFLGTIRELHLAKSTVGSSALDEHPGDSPVSVQERVDMEESLKEASRPSTKFRLGLRRRALQHTLSIQIAKIGLDQMRFNPSSFMALPSIGYGCFTDTTGDLWNRLEVYLVSLTHVLDP